MSELQLGKLVSIHGVSPVFKQRAFIVAALSFVFFTLMVIAYSVRRNFVYILMGAAFLVVELFTLFGWLGQKNIEFRLFENGFSYKNFSCLWEEIESIDIKAESRLMSGAKINCLVRKNGGQEIVLTEVIEGIENIVELIDLKIQSETEI